MSLILHVLGNRVEYGERRKVGEALKGAGSRIFSGPLFYSFTLHTIQGDKLPLPHMSDPTSFTGRWLRKEWSALVLDHGLVLTLNYNLQDWRLTSGNYILAELLRPKTEIN